MKLPQNYNDIDAINRRAVREEYVKRQDGKCYYCENLLTENPPIEVTNLQIDSNLFPKDFFKWPVHLHHDHETGLTIGAVHCYCNAVLWQYYHE